jgi:hypothetical protein
MQFQQALLQRVAEMQIKRGGGTGKGAGRCHDGASGIEEEGEEGTQEEEEEESKEEEGNY